MTWLEISNPPNFHKTCSMTIRNRLDLFRFFEVPFFGKKSLFAKKSEKTKVSLICLRNFRFFQKSCRTHKKILKHQKPSDIFVNSWRSSWDPQRSCFSDPRGSRFEILLYLGTKHFGTLCIIAVAFGICVLPEAPWVRMALKAQACIWSSIERTGTLGRKTTMVVLRPRVPH